MVIILIIIMIKIIMIKIIIIIIKSTLKAVITFLRFPNLQQKPLGKVFDAYALGIQKNRSELEFRYDGDVVEGFSRSYSQKKP
jgi:hypothetical protein